VTFFYPDLDSYVHVTLEPNTLVVCARATLSRSVVDPLYAFYKAEAARVGATFIGYHWLNYGTETAQAQFCFSHVGPDVPLMIDAEDVAGNTGYNRPLTVNNINAFADAYRLLGGRVNLAYIPHWYWQGNMGSPDLRPLEANGLHLVSSNYATYRDDGPGWAPYGGVTPVVWQYADNHPYGGGLVDFNAVRMPYNEFLQLLTVGDMMNWTDILDNGKGARFSAADWVMGTNQAAWATLDEMRRTNQVLTDLGNGVKALNSTLASLALAGQSPVDVATLAEALRTVLGSLAVPPAPKP